jgi:hypothetical protein
MLLVYDVTNPASLKIVEDVMLVEAAKFCPVESMLVLCQISHCIGIHLFSLYSPQDSSGN